MGVALSFLMGCSYVTQKGCEAGPSQPGSICTVTPLVLLPLRGRAFNWRQQYWLLFSSQCLLPMLIA